MIKEIRRQFFHIFAGSIYLALVYFLQREIYILLMAGMFCAGILLSLGHKHIGPIPILEQLLSGVERKEEKEIPAKGALSFMLGVFVTSIIFYPFDKIITLACLAVLTFGDGVSTLAGKLLGKTEVLAHKTLEGSVVGIIVATIAASYFVPLHVALPAAIFGMMMEFLPINDNYTIPIAAGIVVVMLI